MAPGRRSQSKYSFRHHDVNPSFIYENIEKTPLHYVDLDVLTEVERENLLHLAELEINDWKIDTNCDAIFLRQPLRYCNEDEIEYLKSLVHPLKWFYSLIENHQLFIGYSPKFSRLFVNQYLNDCFRLNLFQFYIESKLNSKSNVYFKKTLTFDEYQSISRGDEENQGVALNLIDYFYREIEALTMLDNDSDECLILEENFLKHDFIQLKKHQIKSINWMLKRENQSSIVYSPFHSCHDVLDHPFDVHIISGSILQRHCLRKEEFSLFGGILCDEMGLGKTICVLTTSLLNKAPANFLNDHQQQQSLMMDHQETIISKKIKLETPLCICGKQILYNESEENLWICSICSRRIHKKCYLHIENSQTSFICPFCEQRSVEHQTLLSTGATLIIAPAAIIHQWVEEIDKHLDCPLNVFMYEGIVSKSPIPSRQFLGQQDFLFCSYENLKKDIHHNETCSREQHSTRAQHKKYEYLVSPLLRLKFWRLVLDEAQMVDSPKTPASIMARSVVAHHRWFVTGTPFHRSINDVEGIFQYLFPSNDIPREQIGTLLRKKEKIFNVFIAWLLNIFRLISRRSSRSCLTDLPEQNERIIRLEFSKLERMYYRQIWNQCRNDFKREFEHLWQKHQQQRNHENPSAWTWESNDDIDMIDVHFLSSTARSCLQTPLMKLRCLCDHPQVGAHGVRHNDPALVHYYNRFHYSSTKRMMIKRSASSIEGNTSLMKDDQPFTMKDLLDLLTARELESGEDCLRLTLLKLNGLAAIYLIQEEYPETRRTIENNNREDFLQCAIETYEKVIGIAENNRNAFHADSFQLAHAFFNLSFALSLAERRAHPVSSRYSSDESMKQFEQIKQRFQTQSFNEMNDSWKNYNEKILSKTDFNQDLKLIKENLSDAIKLIENEKIEINYYLNRDHHLPFTTWNGFFYHIIQQFDKLKQLRELLMISVEGLERQPNDEQVANMAACGKCGFDNDPNNENRCIFCEIEPIMKSYNCSLQPEFYTDKQIQEDGGAHLVSYINEILTKASLRSNDSTRQLAKILRTDWSELLKKLRLENSLARNYSQQLKHFYLLMDEMLQCTSRLEFYNGDIQHRPRNLHNRYRFHAESIEEERWDYHHQALNYLEQIDKHRQQFHYFQSQQEEYIRSTSEISSDRSKCPMCHEFFGDDHPNVCFFLCGHFFCQQCTLQWKKHELNQRAHRTHLKCPICRREIPIHSLTVLQWQNSNASTSITTGQHRDESNGLDSGHLRRLIETQENLTVQGRYGTKVDSIVSLILDLLSKNLEPAEATTTNSMKKPLKILIFSQFNDILSVLAISLRLNAISYLQFTSTKILQQFRQDPSITVLLMTLSKGANGLNLTEAQHVILVEPQLHRSVEFQAIARVRRLGQRYETYVYRFIVNDTAEEVVLANSRTAQTITNTGKITTSSIGEIRSIDNQTGSFADQELLHEITMARKIFYQSNIVDDNAMIE